MLNIALWRGDAAPPFEPPASVPLPGQGAAASVSPSALLRQAMARTRTWTAPALCGNTDMVAAVADSLEREPSGDRRGGAPSPASNVAHWVSS